MKALQTFFIGVLGVFLALLLWVVYAAILVDDDRRAMASQDLQQPHFVECRNMHKAANGAVSITWDRCMPAMDEDHD